MRVKVRIVGAGYGGVRAALDLERRLQRRPEVQVTLIDKNAEHQLITESYRPAVGSAHPRALTIPLRDIFGDTRVQLVQAEVTDIRVGEGRLVLDGSKIMSYDRLIVAPGSRPEFFNIPGVAEHCLTIQGVNSAEVVRRHIEKTFGNPLAEAGAGARETPDSARRTVVVIGGGFTGVEFAGELADRIPVMARTMHFRPEDVRIVCIEAASDIMPGFADPLVDAAVETLLRKGVSLEMGVPIVKVESDRIVLKDGREIRAETIIWAGGVRANPLVESSFTTGHRGRAVVNEHLQSIDSDNVYIVGDAALALDPDSGRPVPPTAQHAIEQGRLAARNVWAAIVGLEADSFRSRPFGVIATVGRDVGLAALGGVQLAGRFPAVLKDAATLHYVYSLGGSRLLAKFLRRHWGALLLR